MNGIADGRYYIRSLTGRALEGGSTTFRTDGSPVQTWNLYYGLNQLWDVRRLPASDTYTISNVGGMARLSTQAQDPVELRRSVPSPHGRWRLAPAGGSHYTIRSVTDGRALGIRGNVIDRSGSAQLAPFSSSNPSQVWRFAPAADRAIVRPGVVDLRPNQTPIKSQGTARGACTYFGVTAALEAAYRKAGYGVLDLSEEFWATMAKAMTIHHHWRDIEERGVWRRENQFAGTQGGGSAQWYPTGFRIPTEADVPYRHEEPFTGDWSNLSQRAVNDFNFTLFDRSLIQAPRYYGARYTTRFRQDQLATPAEFERVMNLGYEIVVDLAYPGPNGRSGHQALFVGYDRSTPSAPVFFMKNSWGPQGGDPTQHSEVLPYSLFFDPSRADRIEITGADQISDVRVPGPWPELAFQGRWHLNFDGWPGTLDIYHLPGVGNLPYDQPGIPDRRIGVYRDAGGRDFRVNGSISSNRIVFRIDGSRPNPRWDELGGREFVYYLERSLDVMTGMHTDPDGRVFAGYAAKGGRIHHGTPRQHFFPGLAQSTWNVLAGTTRGTVRFGQISGSRVHGTYTRASDGGTNAATATLLASGEVSLNFGGVYAEARFLSHEPGLLCGQIAGGRPFYAAFVS